MADLSKSRPSSEKRMHLCYLLWAAASGASCLIWINLEGDWSMVYASRVTATEAAHWFFCAYPDHKNIKD